MPAHKYTHIYSPAIKQSEVKQSFLVHNLPKVPWLRLRLWLDDFPDERMPCTERAPHNAAIL